MYPPSSGIAGAAAAEPGRENHFDEFVWMRRRSVVVKQQ